MRRSPGIGGRVLADAIGWMFGLAAVWLYAWIFDPAITSGTVWFIGAMYASVFNALNTIKLKIGA